MAGDDRHSIRRPPPITMGTVLDGLLDEMAKGEPARGLKAVLTCWPEVAGKALAANSSPAALRDRRLLVHVTSPAWLHRLQFAREDLRLKLNAAIGRELVTELRFRIGPVRHDHQEPSC